MKVSRAKRLDHDVPSKAPSQTLCGLCGGGFERAQSHNKSHGTRARITGKGVSATLNGELLRKAKYICRTFESIAVRIQMRSSGGQFKETVNSGPCHDGTIF
ncbi:uncharacterized protein PADG_11919 [Paracoccidioides brasiliensis Pb18]|uniref:Uncharacterized protein n=1 Tax=Paracoccidioides brasiliensis (strain Pb18) TaxID=502780 RepID=A0A0A0HRV5_PARBD|nr:uncharacterized protein PADG_11919 [Paracoccidioides brasiliensis Pb18]KGM91944.1 hypothetical protein PADG_11919 [Paracoccidioides brasiliensis Pb18]